MLKPLEFTKHEKIAILKDAIDFIKNELEYDGSFKVKDHGSQEIIYESKKRSFRKIRRNEKSFTVSV